MIYIVAEHRSDTYCEQWEYSEDRLSRLAHIAHVAIADEGYDRDSEHRVFDGRLLHEVEHEGCCSYDEHDDNNIFKEIEL